MMRVNIYIPEATNRTIELVARAKRVKKAEVVRSALKAGLEAIHPRSTSAANLLKLVEATKKIPVRGKIPKDLVENMDYYTWGGEKNA